MITDGGAVLALARDLGMVPREAAWLYEHDFGAWRYYLVTPLIRPVGRWELYGALSEALPRTEVGSRMNVIDVHLVDPSEEMAGLLASCRAVAAGADPLVEGHTHDGTRDCQEFRAGPVFTAPR